MKRMKKFLATLMAFTMIFAVMSTAGLTAKAEEPTFDITIAKGSTDNDTAFAARTFEAYQIFSGDYTKENDDVTLSNVQWGTGIDADNFLTALKAKNTAYEDCTSAESVANVLANAASSVKDNMAVEFATLAGKYLNATTGTYNQETKKITGVPAGYYLVKDSSDEEDMASDAFSRNMLKVVGDVTIETKPVQPTIDKVIDDGADGVKANTACIGDTIPYKVTTAVPDMTGYEKYFFVINDTMSDGLTFNNDVKVYVEGVEYSAEKYDVITDGQTFEVVFKDFVNIAAEAGDSIVVTYSATLNKNADLTTAGNTNTVDLTYSNNPNVTGQGKDQDHPDEPGDDDVVGETPKAKVITYSTKIQLEKVNGQDHNIKLEGVIFEISGTSMTCVKKDGVTFVKDSEGTYYLLKDGTYTETADGPADKYVNKSVKYKKVESAEDQAKYEKIEAIATTNSDGILTFEGLGTGTYYIKELETKAGYNLLPEPVIVTITGTPAAATCTWNVSTNAEYEDGMVKVLVENNKGSVLPSTGGIGTTIFYVVGGILVVGAAVLLVTKKRMSEEEN